MIILSDCLTDKADEGTIKIASKLSKLLKSKGAHIIQLKGQISFADENIEIGKTGISRRLLKSINSIGGDILYIPNASMTNGVCAKVILLSLFTRKKIFLLPVYRRPVSNIMKMMLEMSKAELIVLSKESYDVYSNRLKNKVHYIKAGVDMDKFRPVDGATKRALRVKNGIPTDEKVVLHVGHMVEARNLRKFLNVPSEYQVIIVVSTSTRWDEALYNDLLKKENIRIIHEYIENIEEFYQMADVYLFLVENIGCVDVPLSVLEAASCNIPVVTTQYGELKALNASDSMIFVNDTDEIADELRKAFECNSVDNRANIKTYDWDKAVNNISTLFKENKTI